MNAVVALNTEKGQIGMVQRHFRIVDIAIINLDLVVQDRSRPPAPFTQAKHRSDIGGSTFLPDSTVIELPCRRAICLHLSCLPSMDLLNPGLLFPASANRTESPV